MSQGIVSAPVRLRAWGMHAPEKILRNSDFEQMLETSDEWIVQRTGIRERHIVADGQYTSDLCKAAIRDLLAHHPDVDIQSVEFIIVASSTPDYSYPSVAAMLQDAFGMQHAGAMDITATCAGFCYGLNLAAGLIASGQVRNVLVIAGDALTRSADYTDRSTCVLFGDGAGVALVERSAEPALFGMDSAADGSAGRFLYRTGMRTEVFGVEDPSRLLRQNGREVYRWVVENVPLAIDRILERAGTSLDAIDWFVPHSANLRMIEALAKRLKFPMERTLTSIEMYGNTSAVSIPLALVPAIRSGRVKPGDRVLLVAFGGGLVLAGSVLTHTA